MRASGLARVALATLLTLLLAAAALPATAGGAAAAGNRDGSSSATVRLVVRTTRGAAAAVTRAAEAAGATRTGQVRRLHSVSFEVPSSQAPRLSNRLSHRADVTSVGVAHRRWFTDEPADPRFPEQRSYLGAIGASAAWDRGALGSPAVRIAIVDSGVDIHHPDLEGKVVGTYNAVTGSTDVHDVVGHGTGTASVAAAATGNGEGIAGSGRDSSLLAVKVADPTGRIFTDDLAAGIVWAADHGANIINLSLGGPTSDRLEKAAVAYAQARNVLVVAAAGNEGTSAKQYPGALPGVVAVGATSPSGSTRAAFSSFGSWVDVGAPGRSIVVATPGGGYESADGTSYSAPLVSGALALLDAYRPGRTATQLAQALVGGTDSARLGFAHGVVHVDRSLDLLPPASAPTLTAPADGSTVGGFITASASSTAAKVRFGLESQSATVAASGGAASTTLETYGLSGQHRVTAVDCSAADQCTDATAASTITVSNPAPVITAPAAGQEVRSDTLSVSADAPGDAAVRFMVDTGVYGEVTDTTAPFSADLSMAKVSDGAHTVRALLCSHDGSVCADGGEVPITVSRLHPAVVGISPASISPDGDGRNDATTVTYRLDRTQTPTLQVLGAGGEVVYRKALGSQAAGTHKATWDGRRSTGGVVRDGSFTVTVSTAAGQLQGLASSTVTVDRTKPVLRAVRASSSRVLPVKDGYLDAVTVSSTPSENLAALRLQVSTRSGAVVRTIRPTVGTGLVVWNGRRADGRVVPGTYRLRLLAQDNAGNRSTSAARTVTVSRQRLVRRSGSTTVTAPASLTQSYEDDCSLVFRRTSGRHKGWMAYSSSSTCTSGDAYAAGDHQVRLPAAVRYGTVRVTAFGGRGDPHFRDSARIVYYDGLQNLSNHSFRLGPSVGTYRGPKVAASPLLIRSRVLRWMTITTGVAWYDVRSYRVDYTYDVLR